MKGLLQEYDAQILIVKGRLAKDLVNLYCNTNGIYRYELFRDIKSDSPQNDIFVYCISSIFDPCIVNDINKEINEGKYEDEGL